MDDVDDDALGCILFAIRTEDFAAASLVCGLLLRKMQQQRRAML